MKNNVFSVTIAELSCIRFKHFICFDLLKLAMKSEGLRIDIGTYILNVVKRLFPQLEDDNNFRVPETVTVTVSEYLKKGHIAIDSVVIAEMFDSAEEIEQRFIYEIDILTRAVYETLRNLNMNVTKISTLSFEAPNDLFIWIPSNE